MRIILIHGMNASPKKHFYPWLFAELRDRGFEVCVPELPLSISDDEGFNLAHIIDAMKKQVGYLKSDDILLGHSLGALVILQYLEAVEMTETPRAVILVGSPWKVSRPELRRLFVEDLDAEVLMWKAREYVIVHSHDDTIVPFEHGAKLAQQLKARMVETQTDGHFMEEKHPVLLEIIDEISKRPFEFAPGMSLGDDYTDIQTLL